MLLHVNMHPHARTHKTHTHTHTHTHTNHQHPRGTTGYPFLGQDFFAAVGDCFSAHAVQNPDVASEELLLKAYAPGVPASLRRRLALCFRDLRELHAAGVLSCE